MTRENNSVRRIILLVISLSAVLFFRFLPAPAGLSVSGMHVLGIFIGVLILWLFEAIDWPSFLALAALAFVPGIRAGDVFAQSFGNQTFAFLLFTFLCTYELSKTSFIRRVAVSFVDNRIARRSPWSFTLLFFASILVLGSFISPTVLFIIYLPILEGIYELVGLKKGDKAASMLIMGLVFLCGISSGMTPIAHVFPLISMGIFESMTGQVIDYGAYMLMAIPTGLAASAGMLLLFRFVLDPDMSGFKNLDVSAMRKDHTEVTRKEKLVLTVFLIVILLWVLPSLTESLLPEISGYISSFGIAMPPLLGVIALSILSEEGKPLLNFREAMAKGIPWASLIICGAALALGAVMTNEEVGIKTFLAESVGPFAMTLTPVVVLILFLVWSSLQTNFSSNIVTATVVTTVAVPILTQIPSLSAGTVAALIGMLSAYAFATPPAMPSVAIAGGSGWTTARQLLIFGSLLMTLSILVSVVIGYPLGAMLIG